MGTFFKALEQAERERALKEQAKAGSVSAVTAPIAVEPPREESGAHRVQAPLSPLPLQRNADKESFPRPESSPEPAAPVSARVDGHLVSLLAPTSFGAEQYRALRLKLEQQHRSSNLSVVGVTSPQAGDGKTLTAINLAGALAQASEARVLIVDADLRRSSMTKYLALESSRGRGLVGAILDPHVPLKDVVEACPPFNLSVIRAGRRPSAPYELLKSPRFGQLLEEARHEYDYVILDMPPLVPLPDCGVIGRSVDGFLIVVAANRTPRKLVEEALKVLDPAAVIGLIFNGDDRPHPGYYYGHTPVETDRAGRWRRSRDDRNSPHEGA